LKKRVNKTFRLIKEEIEKNDLVGSQKQQSGKPTRPVLTGREVKEGELYEKTTTIRRRNLQNKKRSETLPPCFGGGELWQTNKKSFWKGREGRTKGDKKDHSNSP